MAVFVDRRGNISMVRVGIAMVVLGILVVVGGFLLFQIEQQRYKSPLQVELFPGAEEWGRNNERETSRQVLYRVPGGDPEEIFRHYDAELIEHEGANAADGNRERCLRFPSGDEIFDTFREGSGEVPFYYRCMFNDSGFSAIRWTEVTIHPGVLNSETGTDTRGDAVIVYDQRWEP